MITLLPVVAAVVAMFGFLILSAALFGGVAGTIGLLFSLNDLAPLTIIAATVAANLLLAFWALRGVVRTLPLIK